MQQVDIHAHLKGDCRGFEAPHISPSFTPADTHTSSHVIHRSIQEPLCSKPTLVHNMTHKGGNKDTHSHTQSYDILF